MSPQDSHLNNLLRCLSQNSGEVLQYDATQRQLVPYPWPLNESLQPVHADDFAVHHRLYKFSYPTCFCSLLLGTEHDVQSLIHVSIGGSAEKRVVAACIRGACGYFVDLVYRHGCPVQYYPLRVSRNPQLPRPFNTPAGIARPPVEPTTPPPAYLSTKNGYPMGLHVIQAFYPPTTPNTPSIPTLLYRLNSAHRPGLEERIFHRLFTRCECGTVCTTRAFEFHVCQAYVDADLQGGTDIERLDDGELIRLILKLDASNHGLKVAVLNSLLARCICGMVMTKRRFRSHECLPIGW